VMIELLWWRFLCRLSAVNMFVKFSFSNFFSWSTWLDLKRLRQYEIFHLNKPQMYVLWRLKKKLKSGKLDKYYHFFYFILQSNYPADKCGTGWSKGQVNSNLYDMVDQLRYLPDIHCLLFCWKVEDFKFVS